jgi:peptidyl-prolyl cis-trans isomerase C
MKTRIMHHSAALKGLLICTAMATALGASTIVASAPLAEQASDPVVVRVNGVDVRESDIRAADKEMGRNLGPQHEGRREEVIKYLIDTLIVSSAADKAALDEVEIGTRVAFVRNRAISEQVIGAEGRKAVADESAVRKAYDDLVAKMSTDRQYHLYMLDFLILGSGDEAAAKAAGEKVRAARRRIVGGEAFEVVAREMSEDPSTKANGGNRGFVALAELGKEFADVVPKLDKDNVSEPIKTQAGWHLVKVVETRVPRVPDFESIRGRLKDHLAQQAQENLVGRLRAEANVRRLDEQTPDQAAPTK